MCISCTEDGYCQVRKHVVLPYVVNTIYIRVPLPSNKVVLDKYIHSTLVSLLSTAGMTNLMISARTVEGLRSSSSLGRQKTKFSFITLW